MPGSVTSNLHEGSRSELLADYLFSSWGTVTPVRRQDDYGVDLYCTLTDHVGQLGVVTDYYTATARHSPLSRIPVFGSACVAGGRTTAATTIG
jgi:hypothetical protein